MTVENHQEKPFWSTLWGLLLTLCIAVLIFIIFSSIQSFALILYGFYQHDWDTSINIQNMVKELMFNGSAIGFAEIPAVLMGGLLVILFTNIRKPINTSDFLGFYMPSKWSFLKWFAVMALVIVALEYSYILFDREAPEFMAKVYQSATNLPMLWLAVVIAAPVFEELLFRGYLLAGIRQTALGNIGAVAIPALSWAVIHLQYSWYEISAIFIIGIILGIARIMSKSLYIPIMMHLLMNLTASVFMELG